MLIHGRETAARQLVIDIRSGEVDAGTILPDPVCAATHVRLPDPRQVEVRVDATAQVLLDAVSSAPTAALMLPHPFVSLAPCGDCGRPTNVGRPSWGWRTDTRCTDCDGPWLTAPEASVPLMTEQLVHRDTELAQRPLRELGIAPGDSLWIVVPPAAAGTGRRRRRRRPVHDRRVLMRGTLARRARPLELDQLALALHEAASHERQLHRRAPLLLDDTLMIAAAHTAQRLRNLRFFEHDDPFDHTNPMDRVRTAGGTGYITVGENLARGYESARAAVEGWLRSPGHR